MRNCPDRGGGASRAPRSGGLDDGRATSADAVGAPECEPATTRWRKLGRGCDIGFGGSQVVVGEQAPWGWVDGQGHP